MGKSERLVHNFKKDKHIQSGNRKTKNSEYAFYALLYQKQVFRVTDLLILNFLISRTKLMACTKHFGLFHSAVSKLTPGHLGKNSIHYTAGGGTESFRTCLVPSEKPGKQRIFAATAEIKVADGPCR